MRPATFSAVLLDVPGLSTLADALRRRDYTISCATHFLDFRVDRA